MNKLKVYKASAGSGKTFRLVAEYLLIALKNPRGFKNILAITFTNKATEEFKRKLFYYLNGIINNSESPDIVAMKEELEKGLKGKKILTENAELLMSLMLHNYSEISILTIDSFFTKILRSFAMEMNLSFANQIELDKSKVIDDVIDKYFEELTEGMSEVEILKTFLEQKISEGKSRNIENNIKEICGELFKDRYHLLSESNPVTLKYINFLRNLKRNFEKEILNITKDVSLILEKYGLEVSDFKKGSIGFMDKLMKMSEGKLIHINLKMFGDISESDNWSGSKTKKHKLALIEDARSDRLQEIVDNVYKHYNKDYQNYLAAIFILENIYSVALLDSIREKVNKYQTENRFTIITEINRIIQKIVKENYSAPYIYEKIGIYYHHILIDEFQDTSKIQIENLKPLIEEILSNNGNAIIVGDEKQSIYRFRDAYPDYFINIENFFNDSGVQIENKTIEENFRSSPVIVNFNNEFFSKLIENETDDYIKKAFQNITQKAKLNSEGFVEIKLFDPEKAQAKKFWKEKAVNYLYETIISQKNKGFNFNDILILVEKNSQAEEIISELNKLQNKDGNVNPQFDIVSVESLKLINSAEIIFIINFLKYLYDFNNESAEFDILYYLHKKGYKNFTNFNPENYKESGHKRLLQELDEDLKNNIISWTRMSLTEIIFKIAFKYDLFTKASKFIFKLIDVIISASEVNVNDLYSFLEYWENKKLEFSISSNENINAVEVMTIHKSKGLQRKIIIIPYCDVSYEPDGHHDFYWTTHTFDGEPGYNIFLKIKKDIYEIEKFEKSAHEERIKIRLDRINKLYVAFTRAEQKLFIYSPEKEIKKNNERFKNISESLNYLMPDINNINFSPEEKSYSIGTDFENKKKNNSGLISNNFLPPIKNTMDWRNKLVIEKSIIHKSNVANSLTKMNDGIILHKIFSKIKFKEKFDIQKLISESNQDEKEFLSGYAENFEKLFNDRKVTDWFREQNGVEVKIEKPVINEDGDEIRPDRVVINKGGVEIIDFKTSKGLNHQEQLKKYKQYYKELGYKNIKTYLVYINDNIVEEVN
ncbi:MAG: UvrD-helicase domain-containing protein [Ignavibacteria bacterium]|mgnify:CR=1 FL=1|nr:UvrD-helicase domain-containing protein [Ignavibacteria bacterium]